MKSEVNVMKVLLSFVAIPFIFFNSFKSEESSSNSTTCVVTRVVIPPLSMNVIVPSAEMFGLD